MLYHSKFGISLLALVACRIPPVIYCFMTFLLTASNSFCASRHSTVILQSKQWHKISLINQQQQGHRSQRRLSAVSRNRGRMKLAIPEGLGWFNYCSSKWCKMRQFGSNSEWKSHVLSVCFFGWVTYDRCVFFVGVLVWLQELWFVRTVRTPGVDPLWEGFGTFGKVRWKEKCFGFFLLGNVGTPPPCRNELGGFIVFHVRPYLGKKSNSTHIFQMDWFNHQPVTACKGGCVSYDFFCCFMTSWSTPGATQSLQRKILYVYTYIWYIYICFTYMLYMYVIYINTCDILCMFVSVYDLIHIFS